MLDSRISSLRHFSNRETPPPSIPHLSDFLFSSAVTSSAKRQFSSKLDSLISNNSRLISVLEEQARFPYMCTRTGRCQFSQPHLPRLYHTGPIAKRVTEHNEGHEEVAGDGDQGDEREGRRGAAQEEEQKGHDGLIAPATDFHLVSVEGFLSALIINTFKSSL